MDSLLRHIFSSVKFMRVLLCGICILAAIDSHRSSTKNLSGQKWPQVLSQMRALKGQAWFRGDHTLALSHRGFFIVPMTQHGLTQPRIGML